MSSFPLLFRIHVSMDHSKESRSRDEKGQIFEQATVDDNSSEASGINKIDNDDQDGATPITDPSESTPVGNTDSTNTSGTNDTETSGTNEAPVDPVDIADDPTSVSDEAGIDVPAADVTSASTNNIGEKTDSVPNDAENADATANSDASTVDLYSAGSCGAGCKAGVSFASVGLLVGIGAVAAKMAKAKNNEEDDDFESDEEEEDNVEGMDAGDETPAAAEENV